MNRLQELLLRWQDGILTPGESEELARLLESPEAREVLVDDFFTIQTLREGLGAAAVVRPRSRKPFWLAAAAALVTIGIATFLFVGRTGAAVAQVTKVQGTVVGTEGGAILAGATLREGQGLKTSSGAAAWIRLPDGTTVNVGADTTLAGIAAKRLSISRGTVSAVVTRQPEGESIVFTTPHGHATVLGTSLRLLVDTATRLEVTEGKVQLDNLAGKTVVVVSGHYAVAAAGETPVAKRMSPAKAAELVRAMAPDTWLAAPATRLRAAAADPAKYPRIQLVSGVKGVIGAWSGGIYDTRNDRLIVWGGGASTYAGNELYGFRLDDLTWERITEPTADPALGKQINPDGTPAGRGTYNGLAYIAHADRMFATGGAIAANAGNVGADITWTFDFGTRRWVDMKPSGTRPQTQAMNACAYDAATRKVWWVDGTGLFSYDYDANRWTQHTADTGVYDRTAVLDSKRGRLVLVGKGEVLAADLRAPSPRLKAWKTTGGDAFIAGRPGLDYDPVNDRIVGWGGGPVFSLDPDTGVWRSHNAAGAPKATEAGIYGRWRYVPSLEAFVVVTDVDEDVHFFKLGR